MARKTFDARVLVLRKTKLGESDLILTMMDESGQQIRAVAKGARKPTSSFASRLELFSEAEVLLVEGRSLDIVKEVRLLEGHACLRTDYERGSAASPVVELLAHATQPELAVERLYPMTQAAFAAIEQAPLAALSLVSCAFLLKCSALLGFRPSLAACVGCGEPPAGALGSGLRVAFSAEAGGVLCTDCAALEEADFIDRAIVDWAQVLIGSPFSDIGTRSVDANTSAAIIRFTSDWVEAHLCTLKSLAALKSTHSAVLP